MKFGEIRRRFRFLPVPFAPRFKRPEVVVDAVAETDLDQTDLEVELAVGQRGIVVVYLVCRLPKRGHNPCDFWMTFRDDGLKVVSTLVESDSWVALGGGSWRS